jgi:stage II sporulation SpoAA-like protein
MPIALHHESGNLYRVDLRGTLKKAEFERSQSDLAAEIGRLGSVRLLFVLEGFDGWEPTDNWSDLSFYATKGQAIDRIAIVGDERWRSETLMFAGADLRKAAVEFFPTHELSQARAWLAG